MTAARFGTAALAAVAMALAAACGGGGGGPGGTDEAADAAPDPWTAELPSPDAGRDAYGRDKADDPGAGDPGGGDPGTADVSGDAEGADDAADPAPDGASPDAAADTATNDDGPADAAPDAGPECLRLPAPADRARTVAVSFPFGASGSTVPDWALLTLSEDGTLSDPGPRFQMGPAFEGEVAFTPDGQVGIAVQDDGSLGVFRPGRNGTAQVVHAGFRGGFYAARVLMAPGGDHAWVLDTEWRDAGGSTLRGGGVYRVDIACDGTLTDRGMVLPAKLPAALLPLPGRPGRAVLAARDALDVMAGGDVHLLGWGDEPEVLDSARMMGDDASVAGAVATPDGRYVLFGDAGLFSTHGVAVVEVDGDALVPRQFLEGIGNPWVLVAAPSGGAVLVAGAYEPDDLWILDRDDGTPEAPFRLRGKVAYAGGGSQLPTAMVMIDRGSLAGHVLVTEVNGIRQVDLGSDGSVTDRGVFGLGGGAANMPAALGIAP